jgi:hypothetical protein
MMTRKRKPLNKKTVKVKKNVMKNKLIKVIKKLKNPLRKKNQKINL